MIKKQPFYCLGGGWISGLGNGVSGTKPQFSNESASFAYPELEEDLPELPPRFGRFDVYTKVAFATAVLALKDANLLGREGKKKIGIVIGSSSSVYDADIAYYESTIEAKGAFASPNLFSYTLPNVALGEIAVYFKFVGPTFCVGNDPANPGLDVMSAALSMLQSKQCDSILTGWAEVAQSLANHEINPKGAVFAVLSLIKTRNVKGEFVFDHNFSFSNLIEG
jgi:3-oxoacyl-[acyl-carrier-protein] synthase II